ncbi:MAG TPA: BREX-2 system phosphatase PglZ [Micromonosporaceae bacterium]
MTSAVTALPLATEAQVRRLADEWLGGNVNGEVLAIRARPEWAGDPVLTVRGQRVRVVPCLSPLAVRAALVERTSDERLIVLTDCDDDVLGVSLLAHFVKLRVVSIQPWELVLAEFAASALDPALPRQGRWLADALIEHAPSDGWPRVPGGVLTRDHAMRSLAARLLGVEPDDLDAAGILQWTTRSVDVVRYAALDTDIRRGVGEWLGSVGGAAVRWAMASVDSGYGTDAIPLGIVAGLLWHADVPVSTTVTSARVRLEPMIGGRQPTAAEASEWAGAAHAWLERAVDNPENRQVVTRVLSRADDLLRSIQAEPLLRYSDTLPGALADRVQTFGVRLRTALSQPSAKGVADAEAAFREVRKHQLAATSADVRVAEAALRLLRWLATPDTEPLTLADALARHVRDDGWVDRARNDVWAGVNAPNVQGVYRHLLTQVDARRSRHDQQFATLLTQVTEADAAPGSILRVEDVLARVVKPIRDAGRRVLLLVVDGMSVAASTQLVDSITANTWLELTPDGGPRVAVLAALPTVTEVSRTSLFCGKLARGGQAVERAGLAAALGYPVPLLHKADLRAGAGASIDPSVVDMLQDQSVPIVAAVVNTIDDALDRGDPGTTEWSTATLRAVRDLLEHAKDRVVVLLSDHGHVIDRGDEAELRSYPGAGAARWRPASEPAGDGEVLVSGRRVLLGGGTVVLPWRETIRYTPRKAGYHGGASPAEAVIPLTVLSAGDDAAVPGWAGAPIASPAWWRGVATPVTASTVAVVPGEDALFELAPEPKTQPAEAALRTQTQHALVADLLSSEIYQARQKTARAKLPDDRVAALVDALLEAPANRMRLDSLAVAAGVPAHRIRTTVTTLQKLLQVEGYPVLDVDVDGQTVVLNERLLRDQFHLSR